MATTVVEMTGEERRLIQSLQKVIAKEAEHANQLERTGRAGGKAGDGIDRGMKRAEKASVLSLKGIQRAGTDSFRKLRTSAASDLASVAGGFTSLEAGLGKFVELQNAAIAKNRELFSGLQSTEGGDRRLVQIAENAQDFRQLRGRADEIAGKFGIERTDARGLVFSARSENFEDTLEFIAKNAQVIDTTAQSTVAGQLPQLFKGSGLTGTQFINATLAAAKDSRADFEAIARVVPIAAQGGSVAGAKPEEILAATSVLPSRTTSPEVAANLIKAFATKVGLDTGTTAEDRKAFEKKEADRLSSAQLRLRSLTERRDDLQEDLADAPRSRRADLEKALARANRAIDEFDRSQLDKRSFAARESLSGVGLLGAVRKLDSLPEALQRDFLGESQELNQGFILLKKNLNTIEQRAATISEQFGLTGTGRSITAKRRAITLRNPELATLLEERKSRIALEIERDDRALLEGSSQAKANRALATAERDGSSALRIAAAESFGETATGLGFSRENAITLVAGNDLGQLERDLAFSSRSSPGQKLGPLVNAVKELRRARGVDPTALVPRDAAAGYLRNVTGREIFANNITDTERLGLTNQIVAQAKKTTGFGRSATIGVLDALGPLGNLALGSKQLAVNEGLDAAKEIRAGLEAQAAATREQTEVLRQMQTDSQATASATQATAANTQPSQSSFGDAQRAGR